MRITSLRLKGIGPFEDTTITFPAGRNPELADVYLLVGKNGCGKTTALQALASALQSAPGVAERSIEDRFRPGLSAVVATGQHGSRTDLTWGLIAESGLSIEEVAPKGATFGLQQGAGGTNRTYFFGPSAPTPWQTWRESSHDVRLEWAAFAYAGTRRLANVKVTSVYVAPQGSRRHPNLHFATSGDPQTLVQWAANQTYQRLLAREEGNEVVEQAAAESVARIERTISEIIKAPFAFRSSLKDVNVRASVNGVVTEIDLLPEGLKSIVSWLGDLLMNLDGIEWVNPGPIGSREFLLLLDEVDVHLHPEWQRQILPVVQRTFPKAQIIATTHSPFVVASLRDGAVIELKVDDQGIATASRPVEAPFYKSYSQTLASLFGVETDFDLETEQELRRFQEAGRAIGPGDVEGWKRFEDLGRVLGGRSDELAAIVRFEINQARRRGGLTGS
ncbi:MAG: AAA family ATPase [Myxococcaceae bacterium]|jgi:energy-coupling factor transporter ATP-binding protein EcfA2|nr:AAA family ATPase [Myxococcaceae bacterium]